MAQSILHPSMRGCDKLNKIQQFNNHMYDPRYSPAYQIPFQPLYETARLEIERSIFTLEEKFRRRKEIDLELAARPLLASPQLEFEQSYYERLRNIERDQRLLAGMEQQANYQRQLAAQSEQLKRIEMLRKERDILQLEGEYKRGSHEAPFPNRQDENDDEELIKKYENGSKAKQYYKDLELQNQRKSEDSDAYERELLRKERERTERERERKERQQQRQNGKLEKRLFNEGDRQFEHNTHQRPNAAYSDRKDMNNKKVAYDTPYNLLKPYPNTVKKQDHRHSPLAQQLEKQFNKIDEQKVDHLTSKFANTMRQKSSLALKLLQGSSKVNKKEASPHKGMNKYQSLGKFAPYRSKSALSPLKKSYNDSYLQAKRANQNEQPRPSMKQIEINALKKIENRLKVSKVIYEDSQFRNIKYEGNHLYNTFEIESRQRRQIKEKVNSHPFILKKHALVVD